MAGTQEFPGKSRHGMVYIATLWTYNEIGKRATRRRKEPGLDGPPFLKDFDDQSTP
jgi:hypothetical protein